MTDVMFDMKQVAAWESELAELSAHLESATWRQLTLIRELEPSGLWAMHGATSYVAWLSWRIALSPSAAREKVRVARALGHLTKIDDAFRRAKISFSKVRALTRVADASNEQVLLDMALHTTAAHLDDICRALRRVERNERGEIEGRPPIERWARQRVMDDGSVRIEANLLPDEAARVWAAIERARGDGDARRDRADALVRLADSFDPASAREQECELLVHLETDRLRDDTSASPLTAHLDDGAHVPADTLRRVACDCAVRAVVTDADGSPLDVGRRTRVIPRRLKRALLLRDRHCQFPGCAHRAAPHGVGLDAHHIEHWLHGGPTDLANLVLLCPAHHRLVHEGGFTLSVDHGVLSVHAPDGRALPAHHDTPDLVPEPLPWLRWTASAEAPLDDETLLPWWDGAPPDLRACVDAARSRLS